MTSDMMDMAGGGDTFILADNGSDGVFPPVLQPRRGLQRDLVTRGRAKRAFVVAAAEGCRPRVGLA